MPLFVLAQDIHWSIGDRLVATQPKKSDSLSSRSLQLSKAPQFKAHFGPYCCIATNNLKFHIIERLWYMHCGVPAPAGMACFCFRNLENSVVGVIWSCWRCLGTRPQLGLTHLEWAHCSHTGAWTSSHCNSLQAVTPYLMWHSTVKVLQAWTFSGTRWGGLIFTASLRKTQNESSVFLIKFASGVSKWGHKPLSLWEKC